MSTGLVDIYEVKRPQLHLLAAMEKTNRKRLVRKLAKFKIFSRFCRQNVLFYFKVSVKNMKR